MREAEKAEEALYDELEMVEEISELNAMDPTSGGLGGFRRAPDTDNDTADLAAALGGLLAAESAESAEPTEESFVAPVETEAVAAEEAVIKSDEPAGDLDTDALIRALQAASATPDEGSPGENGSIPATTVGHAFLGHPVRLEVQLRNRVPVTASLPKQQSRASELSLERPAVPVGELFRIHSAGRAALSNPAGVDALDRLSIES